METWDRQIAIFKNMTPPLRPHSSEITLFEEVISKMAKFKKADNLKVLLLGVTEEIIHMEWPEKVELTAVDMSEMMIHHFWPGDIEGRRKIVRANWFEMPFPKNSFDLIIGDGVFNFMRYPDGFKNFAKLLSDFLLPDGKLCIRIFNQLEKKESPQDVIDCYDKMQKINFYELRLRLATSLQKNVEDGFYATKESLDEYLVSQGVSMEQLYEKSSHTPPKIAPLPDSERKSYRITYPTNQQFLNQVKSFFDDVEIYNGTHTLAHRTPVFLLSKHED